MRESAETMHARLLGVPAEHESGVLLILDEVHRGATFLRRAERIHLPALTPVEVMQATRRTVEEGTRIGRDALTALADVVHGYPYLLRLAGHGAWRAAGDREELRPT